MDKEEHKARHVELHKAFDELLADFIRHTKPSLPGTPITDLIEWSYKQTTDPTEE